MQCLPDPSVIASHVIPCAVTPRFLSSGVERYLPAPIFEYYLPGPTGSWFGSVNSAVALLTKFGLFAVLCVKTAHKYFPKDLLLSKMKERGSMFVVNGKVKFNGQSWDINAVAHMDKQPLLLVATCSTTLPGDPAVRKRTHLGLDGSWQAVEYHLKQPEISALYRKYFNKIDVHNHIRHSTPSFSDVWGTNTWWHRDFAEMLGFIQTNAHLAWNHFSPQGKALPLHYKQFQKKLAARLINNKFLTQEDVEMCLGKRSRGSAGFDSDSDSEGGDSDGGGGASRNVRHHTLKHIDGSSGSRQLRCSVCSKKCSFYCSCGGPESVYPSVCLCGTATGRECYARHIQPTPLPDRKRKR